MIYTRIFLFWCPTTNCNYLYGICLGAEIFLWRKNGIGKNILIRVKNFYQPIQPSGYRWWPILAICCRLLSGFFGRFGQKFGGKTKPLFFKTSILTRLIKRWDHFWKHYKLQVVNIRYLNDFMWRKVKKNCTLRLKLSSVYSFCTICWKAYLASNGPNFSLRIQNLIFILT